VESPFKSTIAHGFHTLSFSPKVMYDLMEVRNIAMMINYGTDKVCLTALPPNCAHFGIPCTAGFTTLSLAINPCRARYFLTR
jgi:acyl dehydratase